MKLTAAAGSCIYEYLNENGAADYREKLWKNYTGFCKENAFIMFGMDISGIQAFIYKQYNTNDVLKSLRARSFYLELMLENMVDELLGQIGLSRANLIYSGGGRAYILLPNTGAVIQTIAKFENEVKSWLLSRFGTDLYLACRYAECSANSL